MNLWEIDDQIQRLMDEMVDSETGEINQQAYDALDELELKRDEKIENTALYIKNMKAYSAMMSAEILNMQARKKAVERRLAGAQKYLTDYLNGEKFSSPKVGVSFRKSDIVVVSNMASIPEKYLRYKDPEPDKSAIKKVLKSGQAVPGAHLEGNVSILIK